MYQRGTISFIKTTGYGKNEYSKNYFLCHHCTAIALGIHSDFYQMFFRREFAILLQRYGMRGTLLSLPSLVKIGTSILELLANKHK